MALINLRNALMTGKRLPYDVEVEYLESTGTQYILIPVVQTANTHINCRAAFAQGTTNISYIFAYSSPSALGIRLINATNVEAIGSAGSIQVGQLDIGTAHTYDLVVAGTGTYPSCAVKVDDTSVGNVYGRGIDGTNPLALFAYANGSYKSSCRIYSAYVSNGTNVADLIPVRKGTVGYLYDRVTGKLFGNAGTGDFVLGPDVVPVAYIESRRTEYIDTGGVGDSNTTYEAMLWRNTQAANECAIGSWNGGNTRCWIAYYFGNAFYLGMGAHTRSAGTPQPNVWHRQTLKAESSNFNLYIDDVLTVSVPQSTFTSNQPLYIGAMNSSGTASYYFNGRFGAVKIYQNDILVRSFLPVRVGTEGAMMDVLTRRIYRNAGTGAFSYGNDLKYPIPAE